MIRHRLVGRGSILLAACDDGCVLPTRVTLRLRFRLLLLWRACFCSIACLFPFLSTCACLKPIRDWGRFSPNIIMIVSCRHLYILVTVLHAQVNHCCLCEPYKRGRVQYIFHRRYCTARRINSIITIIVTLLWYSISSISSINSVLGIDGHACDRTKNYKTVLEFSTRNRPQDSWLQNPESLFKKVHLLYSLIRQHNVL